MAYTYDISMFQETFESEFTWLNGFMRNVRRFGYRMAAIDPAGGITHSSTPKLTASRTPSKRTA